MLRYITGLILLAGTAAYAANTETAAEQSQTRARAVLDRAVNALGGAEALRDIEVVRLRLDGDTWPRFQMPTPEPPFESGRQQEHLLVDFANNRLLLEQRISGAGFENHQTVVIKREGGAAYDHRARTMTPIPAAQSNQQQFVQYYRRLPHLLLRQALDRAASLRYLGEDTLDGKSQQVFTFVMPDTQQVAVYVDASSGLVSKYELLFVDPLAGDEASEILFKDYVTAGEHRVPTLWQWKQAGDEIARLAIQVELDPKLTDTSFNVAAADYRKVEPVPDQLESRVEKLAQGVYLLHNVADQNYNTLVVEFDRYIAVVEAPGTSEGSDSVIARIKETIPNKPIRYIAMTHHHGDHIGGLRSFIAEGATVITTSGNRKIVEIMSAAPQPDRLAQNPRQPQFAFLEKGRRVLKDGSQRLELIDIGPNPHAKELVVAYLPQHGIVFQGDMFMVPQNNAPVGPPQASTVSFAKRIRELGLKMDRIAGVHGRTATRQEFEAALMPATAQAGRL